jgi:response regulator RpfG family c-di-GMP phosphodiesterase
VKPTIRVLNAEDNAFDADLTERYFQENAPEFKIHTVRTAKAFLSCLREPVFDIVLLDNHLPDRDGIDLLRDLHKSGISVPIVMVTGDGDERLAVQALRLGASDYVVKSGDYMKRLADVLRAVYDEYRDNSRAHGPFSHERRCILYVERSTMDIDLTVSHFADAAPHIDIEAVTTAAAALERLAEAPAIDLLLTDLRVTGANPLDFLHEIKAVTRDIPFIVITGQGDEETAVAALKLGAYDYVVKRDAYLQRLPFTIENAILFTALRRSHARLKVAYDATLAGWGKALELRDNGTDVHTHRVTEMTIKLANAIGIEDVEHIRRGSLLHDIGKIGIPDVILHKEGPLTPDEWKIMRMHPQYAYQWLSPIDYLAPALAIPYCHHEKWNGTGYPRGLAGEDIPIEARLFAVVDVWDALLSDRCYRKAWPASDVVAYLRKEAGVQFDPAVVELFLNLFAGTSQQDEGDPDAQ